MKDTKYNEDAHEAFLELVNAYDGGLDISEYLKVVRAYVDFLKTDKFEYQDTTDADSSDEPIPTQGMYDNDDYVNPEYLKVLQAFYVSLEESEYLKVVENYLEYLENHGSDYHEAPYEDDENFSSGYGSYEPCDDNKQMVQTTIQTRPMMLMGIMVQTTIHSSL